MSANVYRSVLLQVMRDFEAEGKRVRANGEKCGRLLERMKFETFSKDELLAEVRECFESDDRAAEISRMVH